MRFNIVSATTSDSLSLKGLLTQPETNTSQLILHIHGMAGDMYSNSYYNAMYNDYPSADWAFMCVQHRGTGTVTEVLKGEEVILQGNAYEVFEDCVHDIDAWVTKANQLGFKNIWLQSHSLGPSKVAYYMQQTQDPRVSGLIFISPSDMIGLVHTPQAINTHKELLAEAEQLVKQGQGSKLLSKPLWENIILSASSYVSFFANKARCGVFNYNQVRTDWDTVNQLSLPVLAFAGTKDDGIVPIKDAHLAMQQLEQELKHSPRVKTVVFQEAEHDFAGFAKQIVEEVLHFINSQ